MTNDSGMWQEFAGIIESIRLDERADAYEEAGHILLAKAKFWREKAGQVYKNSKQETNNGNTRSV